MSRTKAKILIVLSCGVLVAVTGYAAMTRRSHPVLIRAPFAVNQISGEDHNYTIFNPFRDREPEIIGKIYLREMRNGSCESAQQVTFNPVLPNKMSCESLQQEYRNERTLFVQYLRDRRTVGGDVVLYYSNSGYEGNWVTVRRVAQHWRVVEFNKTW